MVPEWEGRVWDLDREWSVQEARLYVAVILGSGLLGCDQESLSWEGIGWS